jgi:hypothetical protein
VRDDPDRRTRRRATAAVVLLAAGLVVAIAAPIVGGKEFRPSGTWVDAQTLLRQIERSSYTLGPIVPTSTLFEPEDFVGLVGSDPAWSAATAALVAIPLWFIRWRRGAMTFARGIGVLASAAATAALVTLAWPANRFCAAHVLVATPIAYLAAFLVAPPQSCRLCGSTTSATCSR